MTTRTRTYDEAINIISNNSDLCYCRLSQKVTVPLRGCLHRLNKGAMRDNPAQPGQLRFVYQPTFQEHKLNSLDHSVCKIGVNIFWWTAYFGATGGMNLICCFGSEKFITPCSCIFWLSLHRLTLERMGSDKTKDFTLLCRFCWPLGRWVWCLWRKTQTIESIVRKWYKHERFLTLGGFDSTPGNNPTVCITYALSNTQNTAVRVSPRWKVFRIWIISSLFKICGNHTTQNSYDVVFYKFIFTSNILASSVVTLTIIWKGVDADGN